MAHQMPKKRKLDHPMASTDPKVVISTTPAGRRPQLPSANNTSPQKFGSVSNTKTQTAYRDKPDNLSKHEFGDGGVSNIVKIRLQELLLKVRHARGARVKYVEDLLRKIKDIIQSIPNQQGVSILTAQEYLSRKHGISIPFPEPAPDLGAKYTLAYEKPANINVVGSYARQTEVRKEGRVVIDLAITMPSQIFHEKDYVNYRYFHKRAYYLACLAAGIQSSKDLDLAVKFGLQNDNHLQPILLIEPGSHGVGSSESNYQIRLILAAAENLFPIAKTLPNRNCVRAKEADKPALEQTSIATPLYNASLRSECSSLPYLKFMHQSSVSLEAFADACVLGGVWLRKRGLATTLTGGGFGQFEWACLIGLLFQSGGLKGRPVLFKGYNSYQIFKAVLQFLASTNLVAHPLYVHHEDLKLVSYKGPVLFDGVRGLNVLFKMTAWSYGLLRHEALMTTQALNEPLADGFDCSFIIGIEHPFHRFDYRLKLPLALSWQPTSNELDSADRVTQFCREVYDTLSKGLGDRAKLIHLEYSDHNTWSLTSSRPAKGSSPFILIGLLLDAEQSMRSVDHGPPAEEKTAASAFREFWGEKAELRRFKDGSILESLIWSSNESTHSILDQIALYIIQRHVGQEIAATAIFLGNTIYDLLPRQNSVNSNPTILFQPIITAYETFEKDLRNLVGLPLQIRQISATSPELRFASFDFPAINSSARNTRFVNVYVQFEGSTRWPNDLSAVQRTKIAFLLKIGDLLEQSSTGLTARLGLENDKHRILNQSFLDITYSGKANRATFRLRIHHERELSMLKTLVKDRANDSASRTEITTAMATYKRDFIQGPLHTQAVRTLGTRFPLLSPSIRLMKKWRDSHLLSSHISDELIELLTIRTFVQPYPWEAPASLITGFLRTLDFISKWDWQFEPLIVDFTHKISAQDIEGIHLRFEAWRKIDPAMNRIAMFAASTMDPDGVTWTEQGPSKVIAARFSTLAKAACDCVKEQALDFQAESLFAPSTAEYDFILHLNPRFFIRGSKQNIPMNPNRFKNLQLHADESSSRVGSEYDLMHAFLEELERLYGANVLFFHNAHETSLIAGIWNQRTTGLRNWKVDVNYSSRPVMPQSEDGGGWEAMISINQDATLHDIVRLGGDLVVRVEMNKRKE